MKVLFAIDGSAGSFEALAQVGPLLTPVRDEIILYCSPPHVKLASKAVTAEMVAAAQTALADSILAEAVKRLPNEWQPAAKRLVGTADARHGILAASEQTHAEMIVVGARGLSRFERLFLGSVSRAVVHGSRVPVWIARPRPTTAPSAYQILLCCENASTARCPLELLSKLAWPEGTACSALTVISSVFAGRLPAWLEEQARSPDVDEMVRHWVREHDEEVQKNLAEMGQCLKDFPGKFSQARPLVAEGEAVEHILAETGRQHADLVVLGARQARSTAATIFGSTAEAVLNHAGCSVLVVPHPETC